MVTTIGNPMSWGAKVFGRAGGEVALALEGMGGEVIAEPVVQKIGTEDIRQALKSGLADFAALRTDVIVICLLYPVMGALLVYLALNQSLAHLVFPLVAGFALLGPAVAVGFYEMSRQRAVGQSVNWGSALAVLQSRSFGAILVLGLMLVGTFLLWMIVAWGLYRATLGPEAPASAVALLDEVFTTGAGWVLAVTGIATGFVFALVVLCVSVVSFPMLIDRPVGLPRAVVTSVRVAQRNPGTVALWGLIVAAGLVIGSLPMLLGLVVVLPVLGHATWHLYRRAVTIG
ncbi:MAG: hypothetical protein RLZZ528_1205 [Pseudomonadota bacterium]